MVLYIDKREIEMSEDKNDSALSVESVRKLIQETFAVKGKPQIEDYIPDELVSYLGRKFYKEKNIKYALDKYSQLDANEKNEVIKFYEKDHVSEPKIVTLIDAINWFKLTDKSQPITVHNLPAILQDYIKRANMLRKELLVAYGEATIDMESRLDVAVRYSMFQLSVNQNVDYNFIAQQAKAMDLNPPQN